MDKNSNSLNWFEIPVIDGARAKKFYESIFSVQLTNMGELNGKTITAFPTENGNGKASGGLVQSPAHKPSMEGAIIFLNANPNIQPVIDRIETVGGKMITPKTHVSPEIGYTALFIDSEGNKVGLHAQN
jgi:uncharacterized protein